MFDLIYQNPLYFADTHFIFPKKYASISIGKYLVSSTIHWFLWVRTRRAAIYQVENAVVDVSISYTRVLREHGICGEIAW